LRIWISIMLSIEKLKRNSRDSTLFYGRSVCPGPWIRNYQGRAEEKLFFSPLGNDILLRFWDPHLSNCTLPRIELSWLIYTTKAMHVNPWYLMPLVEVCAICCARRAGCCSLHALPMTTAGETDSWRIDRAPLCGTVPMIAERGAADAMWHWWSYE
jgi:hypothetical protein